MKKFIIATAAIALLAGQVQAEKITFTPAYDLSYAYSGPEEHMSSVTFYFAAMRSNHAFTVDYPDHVKVYRAVMYSDYRYGYEEGKLCCMVPYKAYDVIPANTPVIIKADTNNSQYHTFTVSNSSATPDETVLFTNYTAGQSYSSATMPTLYRVLTEYSDMMMPGAYCIELEDGDVMTDNQVYSLYPMAPQFANSMSLADAITSPWPEPSDLLCIEDYDLTVAYEDIDNGLLFCKDNKGHKFPSVNENGYTDYMMSYSGLISKKYDQSYWITLYCPDIKGVESEHGKWAGHQIAGVMGNSDSKLGQIHLTHKSRSLTLLTKPEIGPLDPDFAIGSVLSTEDNINTYVPASFLGTQQGSDGNNYFFVSPKLNEVCDITWAVWDSENQAFLYPQSGVNGSYMNQYGLKGGIKADFHLNTQNGNQAYLVSQGGDLVDGEAYKFRALVIRRQDFGELPSTGGAYGLVGGGNWPDENGEQSNNHLAPRRVIGDASSISDKYIVLPLDLTTNPDQVVTEIVTVKTPRQVQGIEYVNLAGQHSDAPFDGVSIVVTRYTDGTTSTSKVIR